MAGGMRGRGFFAGAIGGLALALLLVGVASFLPHSNGPVQTALTPQRGAAPATSTATTNVAPSASTTTSSGVKVASPGAQNEAAGGPANSAATTTTTVPLTTTAVATTTVSGGSVTTAPLRGGNASVQGGPTASSGATQRPSSLLTVLPGESLASLLATLSPLIVGLLVAALVYGAYTRRQDSSS